MAAYILAFLLAIRALAPAWALQVTPNSPCATQCIDYAGTDPSDPNVSNTYGSDIVCNDADYNSTATGLKFQNCISCLQNSTASNEDETDQSWFLYNLRFAFDTCLYNSTNATDVIDTPCALSTTCGPLQTALEFDMQSYSVPLEYAYCSADGKIFASSYFSTCQQCLRETADVFYLSNFLTALQAGCAQQPANGSVIGLNGTLFSNNEVEIVSFITAAALAAKAPHKILTRGAIAGIAVGGVVALLILVACIFVCIKKRLNAARLKELQSPLDGRFGAENITAPNQGAYASPESPPMKGMYKTSAQNSPSPANESIQMMRGPKVRNFSFHRRKDEPQNPRPNWEETQTQSGAQLDQRPTDNLSPGPPRYSSPDQSRQYRESIPTHHAYIPPQYVPSSRNSVSPMNNGRSNKPQPLFSNPPLSGQGGIPAPHPQRFTPSPPSSATLTTRSGSSPSPTSHPPPLPGPHPTPSPQPTTALSRALSTASRFRPYPSNHTRSVSNTSGLHISAPVMHIGTRFESDEEARRARERLYHNGLGSTKGVGFGGLQLMGGLSSEEERGDDKASPASASTAVSQEMWPGSF